VISACPSDNLPRYYETGPTAVDAANIPSGKSMRSRMWLLGVVFLVLFVLFMLFDMMLLVHRAMGTSSWSGSRTRTILSHDRHGESGDQNSCQ
jgi:hypothetical protein